MVPNSSQRLSSTLNRLANQSTNIDIAKHLYCSPSSHPHLPTFFDFASFTSFLKASLSWCPSFFVAGTANHDIPVRLATEPGLLLPRLRLRTVQSSVSTEIPSETEGQTLDSQFLQTLGSPRDPVSSTSSLQVIEYHQQLPWPPVHEDMMRTKVFQHRSSEDTYSRRCIAPWRFSFSDGPSESQPCYSIQLIERTINPQFEFSQRYIPLLARPVLSGFGIDGRGFVGR